jgi:hypothetical protein
MAHPVARTTLFGNSCVGGQIGNNSAGELLRLRDSEPGRETVNGLIYLVGLIVVILFILSFFGLR